MPELSDRPFTKSFSNKNNNNKTKYKLHNKIIFFLLHLKYKTKNSPLCDINDDVDNFAIELLQS